MFDQMKAAFKKAKSKDAPVTADASGGIVHREQKPVTESKPAVDLGDALLHAGSGVTPAPAAPEAPHASLAPTVTQSIPDPTETKVLAFIRICHVTDGLTYREISGGTSLPISDVRRALELLVENGTVKHSGEPEPNYRRYTLTASMPESPAPPAQDPRSAEQRWSDEAAAKQRAADEALKPKPQPRYEPSESEVQAAMAAEEARRKAIKFTPEEREELRRMEGRTPRNPQVAIVPPKRS